MIAAGVRLTAPAVAQTVQPSPPPLYNMGASPSLPSSNPLVLWSGIDTLEVSYSGGVSDAWSGYLDHCKRLAQKRETPTPVVVQGEALSISRSGLKPWAWVLRGPDFHIRIGRGKVGHSIRLLSMGLAAHGASVLLERAERVIAEVGTLTNPRISRIDVALDVQGWVPDVGAMVDAVCPASFRPIYPSVSNPETYQFGRGSIVARVYNKTREVSGTGSHWPGVWVVHPEYEPSEDVWRVEFQFRSDALRDFGMVTPSDALCGVGSLAATGFQWLSVRVPEGHSNRRRRAIDPSWEFLAASFREFEPLTRCIDVRSSTSAHAFVPMVSGCLVSIGAHLGLHDPHEVCRWLVAAMGDRHAEQGYDFSQLVRDRQRDIYGASTVEGLEPGYAYTGLF